MLLTYHDLFKKIQPDQYWTWTMDLSRAWWMQSFWQFEFAQNGKGVVGTQKNH